MERRRDGIDVGVLAGIGPIGISATLRSGKSVISLTGDHSMPAAAGNGFGEAVEEACRIGGSTFTVAGVNPGFIAERLVPTLTGLCADATAVTIAETFDIELVDVKLSCEVIPAHRDIGVAGRVVSQGTVAAISQVWESVPKDSDSIALKKVTQWAYSDDIPSVLVSRGMAGRDYRESESRPQLGERPR